MPGLTGIMSGMLGGLQAGLTKKICEINNLKLVLGVDGDDGVLLFENEEELCTYTAGMDIMVKFKCEDLIDCVHKNLTVLDILSAVTINFTIEEVLPYGDTIGTLVKSTPYYEFNMTSGSTGVYITGIDDESCKCDLFDQIKDELEGRGESCNILSDYSFGAIWKRYKFDIPKTYEGGMIKLGIVITKSDCCDFSLLVDNIAIEKDCEGIRYKDTKVLSPPGFDLERICDNKKSWVRNNGLDLRQHTLDFRQTDYTTEDDRLTINTKEVDIQIDPSSAIECDVVDFLSGTTCTTYSGNCGVGTISTSGLCKDCISIFENDAYEGLIDIKNRQTIGSYPRLRMVFDRYLYNSDCCVSGTTVLSYDNVHQFSKLLNPRWMEIIEEMVPSTSIWSGSLVIRNTIFDQQKLKYKDYGLNTVCGTASLASFNELTEGTDYISGGSTSNSTVEVIKEELLIGDLTLRFTEGGNTITWSEYELTDFSGIPPEITAIAEVGGGTIASKVDDVWVGSLNTLVPGDVYTFMTTGSVSWSPFGLNCERCDEKKQPSCDKVYITKFGAEHMFIGGIGSEKKLWITATGGLSIEGSTDGGGDGAYDGGVGSALAWTETDTSTNYGNNIYNAEEDI